MHRFREGRNLGEFRWTCGINYVQFRVLIELSAKSKLILYTLCRFTNFALGTELLPSKFQQIGKIRNTTMQRFQKLHQSANIFGELQVEKEFIRKLLRRLFQKMHTEISQICGIGMYGFQNICRFSEFTETVNFNGTVQCTNRKICSKGLSVIAADSQIFWNGVMEYKNPI